MPELTACVHSGVVQFATPSGGRGRAKTNWPPSAAASKSAPALVHVWNVASRVVNRSPRAAKFQWSPLRHRPDGSEPPASYHCSGSDAFGTSGEGTRVQRARSVETTWSQWFWQHWWKTWYTPLYRRMPDASLIG